MTDIPDAAVIAELADQARARDIVTIVEGRVAGVVLAPGQTLTRFDLEQYESTPDRKRGTVTLTDADSFVTYVERHKESICTTLWGDITAGRVVAVLDDHAQDNDTAGWGQHRAVLQLTHTPDWTHWCSRDGKLLEQATFAEHIEDGADAIREPDPATMLEVAQSFQAKRGVNFSSSRHLGGEIEFGYEETIAARAGQKGKLDVPSLFTLGLAPFEGSSLYEVRARLRFRLTDGALTLGYRLIRADKTRRAAFDELIATIAGGADLPVMAGTPRP